MNVFFLITAFIVFKFFSSSITAKITSLLPVVQPQLFKKQRDLKKEINESIKEKNSLSPQNQYAKWTKLNRRIEKLEKELASLQEKIAGGVDTFKKISSKLNILITLSFFVLRFYYRSEKMFFLPSNAFPSVLEILVSFNVVQFAKNALFFKFDFNDRGFLTINNWSLLFDVFLGQLWFVYDTLTQPTLVKPELPASLKSKA